MNGRGWGLGARQTRKGQEQVKWQKANGKSEGARDLIILALHFTSREAGYRE
jgi:hypothetical protein